MPTKANFFKMVCLVFLLCGGVIVGKWVISGGWPSFLFSGAHAEEVVFALYEVEKKDPKSPDSKESLASFGKPTMLILWTIGCMPCFNELILINELAPKIRAQGGEVAPILLSPQWGGAVAFLSHMSRRGGANQEKTWRDLFPHLPSYYDFEGKVSTYFGVQRVPLVVFLDASGKEIERYEGFKKWNEPENMKILSEHLKIDLSAPVAKSGLDVPEKAAAAA
jgi:hypothetical protein